MTVYSCFPLGKRKALTMSYDDAAIEDERLVEIFNRYGIKGTFNINYGSYPIKERLRIPPERMKTLYAGHEIATHSLSHPTLTLCSLVEVANQILKDRLGLEQITGGLVRGHAYPNGCYNQEIKQLFKQLGIAYARTVDATYSFNLPEDPMQWDPTCHHKDPDLMKKAEAFLNYKKTNQLKLMYVWGHSFEFGIDNNWEVIEEFCRYVGGKEDIWYATNIEIVDYMEAVRNLKFAANNESVYNPSAVSVWLAVDGRVVEIKGGAYVVLSNV